MFFIAGNQSYLKPSTDLLIILSERLQRILFPFMLLITITITCTLIQIERKNIATLELLQDIYICIKRNTDDGSLESGRKTKAMNEK